MYCGISSMKITKRIGRRTDPWGSPLVTGTAQIQSMTDRPDRKYFIQFLAFFNQYRIVCEV